MRVVITGGAGFIGSHLAEAYLDRGDEVCVIDDLSTGSLENLRHLQENLEKNARLHLEINSILSRKLLRNLIAECDQVIHLAAAVGVQYVLDNPLSTITTNVRGTETVLELCQQFHKKVLIASTSEVYGKCLHGPLHEDDDCMYGSSLKSRWGYAASKLINEFSALAYHRSLQLPVVIVRFFNTVGPRQSGRYGMVVPRFVEQAIKRQPMTVYGDGQQTRTFTHVRDTCTAIMRLMEMPAAVGEVVNVGGAEEVSILSLAQRIREKIESESEIRLVPYDRAFPADFEDIRRRVPSTTKLRCLTGFTPGILLDDILSDVIAHHRAAIAMATCSMPRRSGAVVCADSSVRTNSLQAAL